jgi:hypothetical protein
MRKIKYMKHSFQFECSITITIYDTRHAIYKLTKPIELKYNKVKSNLTSSI